jgi:hypothetical protein
MRVITTLVLTAILVGGCASARDSAVYEKAGVDGQQKRADAAACTRAALDTAGQRGATFLAVDRDTVDDCMRARGYTVATRK